MPKLSQQCLDDLNQAIPFTDLLKVSTKYRGECSCPFCGSDHHVKVYLNQNAAHCAKCGADFNMIQAWEKIHGLNDPDDLPQAAKEISEQYKVPLEYENGSAEFPPDREESSAQKSTSQDAHTGTETQPADEITVDDEKALKTQNTASEDIPPEMIEELGRRIEQAKSALHSEAGRGALDFLHQRGLTDEIIDKYKLGYSASEYFIKAKDAGQNPHRAAIIFPHGNVKNYYSCRSLEGKFFAKLLETKPDWDTENRIPYGGRQTLYNAVGLRKEKPCFVCEGELDALSIIQCGGAAVSLCGTAWEKVLMPYLENKNFYSGIYPLILSLDIDPPDEKGSRPGQDTQKKIAAALDEKGIPYINAHFSLDKYPDGKKDDPNSLLQLDPLQLREDVNRLEEEALRKLKPDNILDYMQGGGMAADIRSLKLDARRKTGFENLDNKIHALFSGLYVIGGMSGSGKSTWTWQLADQLAEQGENVIYFSLEMSKLELISKSISRLTFQMSSGQNGVEGSAYRMGLGGSIAEQAKQKYIRTVGDRISIVQGDFNFSTRKIRETVDQYIKYNHKRPTIIIDYLQVLAATADPDTGRKTTDIRQQTNQDIVELKRISRDFKIPVICLSAMNRQSYDDSITFSSFRESSAIEFSADFVAGLELRIMSDQNYILEDNAFKKNKILETENKQLPRRIQFHCLKNRFADANFYVYFNYYYKYDLFEVADYIPPKNKDEWSRLSEGEQESLPFTE